MGQQFQIIISAPGWYVNDNNPNNKGREWFIYHCQWLYGSTAVNVAARLIKDLKTLRAEHDGKIIKAFHWAEAIPKAIEHTKTSFFPDSLRLCSYYDDDIPTNNHLLKYGTWADVFQSLDNNNGYLIIYINGREIINYCFYNMPYTEDAKYSGEPLDAEKYLMGYYPRDKWAEVEPSPIEALKYLSDVALFRTFKHSDAVSLLVQQMKLEYYNAQIKKIMHCIKVKTELGAKNKARAQINKGIAKDDFYIDVTPSYSWEGIAYKRG